MAGNECAEKKDFRLFVVTFLPQIAFYDYIHVAEIERIEGNDIFRYEANNFYFISVCFVCTVPFYVYRIVYLVYVCVIFQR